MGRKNVRLVSCRTRQASSGNVMGSSRCLDHHLPEYEQAHKQHNKPDRPYDPGEQQNASCQQVWNAHQAADAVKDGSHHGDQAKFMAIFRSLCHHGHHCITQRSSPCLSYDKRGVDVKMEEREEVRHEQRQDPERSSCEGTHNEIDLHSATGEVRLWLRDSPMANEEQAADGDEE